MKLIRSIQNLEKSITRLSKNLESRGGCSHELEEIRYYYDDDWGHRGSVAWDSDWKEKEFCYCKKCGQVFLRARRMKNERNIIPRKEKELA